MVLVTSRGKLSALGALEGVHTVSVSVLPETEAVGLLGRVIGDSRPDDDPDQLAELAWLCACLPLALRIAGERLAARPRTPLGEFLVELNDESTRLDVLAAGGEAGGAAGGEAASAVRTVFSWSYRGLPAAAAELFRRLGSHPGPRYSVASVATMCGLAPDRVRAVFDILVAAHLVDQVASDTYEFHDLLRAYAAGLSRRVDGEARFRSDRMRVAAWYFDAASAASQAMGTDTLSVSRPADWPLPVEDVVFADYDGARAWYDSERENLTATVLAAAAAGGDGLAWRLAAVLLGPYAGNNAFDDWFTVTKCGLDAARRSGDRVGESVMLESMGKACLQTRQLEPAEQYQREALAIREELGDLAGQGRSVNALGLVDLAAGRHGPARERFERARLLATGAGDRRMAAYTLLNLGTVDTAMGAFQTALGEIEAALTIFRDARQPAAEANALIDLGAVLRGLRRNDEALAVTARAVAMTAALRNRAHLALALMEAARAHRAVGDPDQAMTCYAEAVSIQRALGDRSREAVVLDEIGEAYAESGRAELAIGFHAEAAQIHRELGDTRLEARARRNLAMAQECGSNG